jgi:tRNA(Arg) A34 adenosine deaminase TadA
MAGAAAGLSPRAAAAQRAQDREFMARAAAMRDLALRQGDQGFGAAMAKDGRIVAESPSRVVTRNDPTAHAETECVRDAAKALGTRSLAGCTLYASFRPCAMCEAAAYWAGVTRIVHGETLTDIGAPQLRRC